MGEGVNLEMKHILYIIHILDIYRDNIFLYIEDFFSIFGIARTAMHCESRDLLRYGGMLSAKILKKLCVLKCILINYQAKTRGGWFSCLRR